MCHKLGGSAHSDQLKNAMHFAIYIVYFSSRKTTPLSGSWKHPHKYLKEGQSFHIEGLPFLLQAVRKISKGNGIPITGHEGP